MANEEDRLVVRKRIAATREELFDEWTNPEAMGSWMCPGDVVSSEVALDVRVGGSLLIRMHTPTAVYEQRGEFTMVDRPSRLAFTWVAKATNWQTTLVTVEFFRINDTETELVLTQEGFPREETRDQYRGGWSQILKRLEERVDEGSKQK